MYRENESMLCVSVCIYLSYLDVLKKDILSSVIVQDPLTTVAISDTKFSMKTLSTTSL